MRVRVRVLALEINEDGKVPTHQRLRLVQPVRSFEQFCKIREKDRYGWMIWPELRLANG
jgi:hypothetical protein